ncbi:carboxymuconolactone decarboxylase family protein [Variovorax sp. CAN2819]|uniref:carboxymuconolactone decarboxylase family protein n=1 Tax=Variovorax sp. CAN15 TaxID=3046727 RepID=UPI002648B257|nr:carboxymuconolactone decarboxylase family protein [Variovorax sp. CAN15]MDN6882387.1 carboxymuconolactone decarboxylase family protein [Variovorax sp. CAN15]
MTNELYEKGMKRRRRVLGDAHVDRASAATTDVTRDFQDLIVRYGWGEVWTRPDLGLRERRILVMGTMIALGRWDELRLHLRAALQNQMSLCDIKEVLLQQAIYCGIPAANTAYHHLSAVLAELAAEGTAINRTPTLATEA